MSGPVFRLKSFSPLPEMKPLDVIDVSPWLTSLALTQARPGGYTAITVGLTELPVADAAGQNRGWPFLPRPIYVQNLGHIELWCGATIVAEGRLAQTDTTGSVCTGLRAEGYATQALQDDVWYPLPNAEDTTQHTSGSLLRQCLVDTCPLIPAPASADFFDPGVLHGYSAFDGKNAWQLAQQFGTEGDGTNLYDVLLFAGRRLMFLPRLMPSTADYVEDWDAGVSNSTTAADLVGTVYVRYTDAVSGASNQRAGPFTDPTFALRNGGLSRTKEIQGGTLDAAGAAAFGQTQLAKYKNPTYRIQVKRDAGRGLRLPSGGYRAPWFARCDQWMQVGADLPPLPIIRLDVNVSTGQTTVQLGDPPVNALELVRGLSRVATLLTRGQNPNSYAR